MKRSLSIGVRRRAIPPVSRNHPEQPKLPEYPQEVWYRALIPFQAQPVNFVHAGVVAGQESWRG